MYENNNYQQPGTNVVPQQPIMQGQQQQPVSNELKSGEGIVIASLPKVNGQTGVAITGVGNKGNWALYKIQVQCEHGQPSFSFFQTTEKPAPQLGQTISYKYSEKPNPHGDGAPMKTIAFYNVSTQNLASNATQGQPIPPPPQPIQPVNSFQGVNTQPVQQSPIDVDMTAFIKQYKTSVTTSGQQPDEAHALGTYLLQKLSDRPTTINFRNTWNGVQ